MFPSIFLQNDNGPPSLQLHFLVKPIGGAPSKTNDSRASKVSKDPEKEETMKTERKQRALLALTAWNSGL